MTAEERALHLEVIRFYAKKLPKTNLKDYYSGRESFDDILGAFPTNDIQKQETQLKFLYGDLTKKKRMFKLFADDLGGSRADSRAREFVQYIFNSDYSRALDDMRRDLKFVNLVLRTNDIKLSDTVLDNWLGDDKDEIIRRSKEYGRTHNWGSFVFRLMIEAEVEARKDIENLIAMSKALDDSSRLVRAEQAILKRDDITFAEKKEQITAKLHEFVTDMVTEFIDKEFAKFEESASQKKGFVTPKKKPSESYLEKFASTSSQKERLEQVFKEAVKDLLKEYKTKETKVELQERHAKEQIENLVAFLKNQMAENGSKVVKASEKYQKEVSTADKLFIGLPLLREYDRCVNSYIKILENEKKSPEDRIDQVQKRVKKHLAAKDRQRYPLTNDPLQHVQSRLLNIDATKPLEQEQQTVNRSTSRRRK